MALSGLALCTVLLGVVYVTTALPTYHLPEEYWQQGDFQGYGAPYEQLRNQDLAKMANILMSENREVNVANYPYDLSEDSTLPAAEAANLPMFGGYGAAYEQLRNQDFAETAKIPNLPMFEMPEDNRFMQVDEQNEQNKGDMHRYGGYGYGRARPRFFGR